MGLNSYGQAPDNDLQEVHSPRKATILSAVLPGAGQIYNQKYWKAPIVYVGFGVLGYFIYDNYNTYTTYKKAYEIRTDGNPATVDDFPLYSEDGLIQAMNYYRRNTELSVIFSAILYALNIVDAAVDAHLYDFDISEDLSFRISPVMQSNALNHFEQVKGIKLTFKF